jgi:hypothetical protein
MQIDPVERSVSYLIDDLRFDFMGLLWSFESLVENCSQSRSDDVILQVGLTEARQNTVSMYKTRDLSQSNGSSAPARKMNCIFFLNSSISNQRTVVALVLSFTIPVSLFRLFRATKWSASCLEVVHRVLRVVNALRAVIIWSLQSRTPRRMLLSRFRQNLQRTPLGKRKLPHPKKRRMRPLALPLLPKRMPSR